MQATSIQAMSAIAAKNENSMLASRILGDRCAASPAQLARNAGMKSTVEPVSNQKRVRMMARDQKEKPCRGSIVQSMYAPPIPHDFEIP